MQLYSIKKKFCEEKLLHGLNSIRVELCVSIASDELLTTNFVRNWYFLCFFFFFALSLYCLHAHTHTQTANCGKFVWKKRICCGKSRDIDSKSSNLLPVLWAVHTTFFRRLPKRWRTTIYIQITEQPARHRLEHPHTHTRVGKLDFHTH